MPICDQCLDGAGGKCHTPGCIFWGDFAPDAPIREKLKRMGCEGRSVIAARKEHEDMGVRVQGKKKTVNMGMAGVRISKISTVKIIDGSRMFVTPLPPGQELGRIINRLAANRNAS